jgi:Uncharacterized conserved protein
MYIYQHKDWPNYVWDINVIGPKIAAVNKAAGYLCGRLSAIGFDAQNLAAVETTTHDIVASSQIEGVQLNSDQVRSSVARRMGIQIVNETEPSRYIDGIVEMMLDATHNYKSPLTARDCLVGITASFRPVITEWRR